MPLNTITDIYPMINETCCIYKIDFLSVNCFYTNVKYICNSYVLMTDSEVFLSAFVTAFWLVFQLSANKLSRVFRQLSAFHHASCVCNRTMEVIGGLDKNGKKLYVICLFAWCVFIHLQICPVCGINLLHLLTQT